jgi:serine/threonine protein kinase
MIMDRYYKIGEKLNEYSILKIIGEGRFGIAYLAVNHKSQKYVIKQLKKKI